MTNTELESALVRATRGSVAGAVGIGPPIPALGEPRAGVGGHFTPFQGREPRQPPKTAAVTVRARNGGTGADAHALLDAIAARAPNAHIGPP